MRKILDERQTAEVVQRYIAGESTGDLAKYYRVCKYNINTLLRRNNVTIRTANETKKFKYPINEKAFDQITDESAYWIGMLLSDGCIVYHANSSPKIVLALAEHDRDHVEKFAKFLGCTNHKITKIKRVKGGYNAMFTATSKKLVDKLAEFGVKPRKSLTATPTPELCFNRHFWRGMIDGDGCIKLQANKYPVISLVGSQSVCEAFAAYVKSITSCWAKVIPHKTIWGFTTSAVFAVAVIKNLYENCTVSLNRKQKLANEFMNWKGKTEYLHNGYNFVTHNGKTQQISEWADELGIPYTTIWNRLERGWPVEEALKNTNKKNHLLTFNGKTQNITDWAQEVGLPRSLIYARLRQGWSVARALSKGKNHKIRLTSEKNNKTSCTAQTTTTHSVRLSPYIPKKGNKWQSQ